MPRFSVLLPTHNRADVVGFAIRSVLEQTEIDFELLIVGDGCTDATPEVVRSFDDARIVWLDLPKAAGFGYANRNVALRAARGELIAYAPHDDLLFRDHLEVLARQIDASGVDWIHSRALWVTPAGTIAPGFVNLAHDDEVEDFMVRANGIPAGTVVHRRDCFERFGYWPENIERSGDWEIWRQFFRGGADLSLARRPDDAPFHRRLAARHGEGIEDAQGLRPAGGAKGMVARGFAGGCPRGRAGTSGGVRSDAARRSGVVHRHSRGYRPGDAATCPGLRCASARNHGATGRGKEESEPPSPGGRRMR